MLQQEQRIEPLVKQFRNDDPNTYLTNEGQMKGMLLATIEGETPKVDEELLNWQYARYWLQVTAAAAIPGSSALYEARLGIPEAKFVGPIQKGVGPTSAALGLKPVLGKFLAGSFLSIRSSSYFTYKRGSSKKRRNRVGRYCNRSL